MKRKKLNIEKEKVEDRLLLKLEGRMDTNTAPMFQKYLDKELKSITELILDMEKLDYISSAGLRALLAVSKKLDKEEGSMTIINVGSKVEEIFVITGFDRILTIEQKTEEKESEKNAEEFSACVEEGEKDESQR